MASLRLLPLLRHSLERYELLKMGKRGGGAGVQIVREDKDRVDNERQSPIINEVGLTELVGGQVENMDRFDSINVPVSALFVS